MISYVVAGPPERSSEVRWRGGLWSVPLEQNDGGVIGESVALMVENSAHELAHDLLGFELIGGVLTGEVHEAVHAERLFPGQMGLDHAIGVEEDAVAGLERLGRRGRIDRRYRWSSPDPTARWVRSAVHRAPFPRG